MNSIPNANTLAIVIFALCVVGGISVLLFYLAIVRPKRGEAASARPGASGDPLSPHLVAVLTAAALAAVGRRAAVRRITFINRDTVSGWATAGRTSIQLSHNLRRMI